MSESPLALRLGVAASIAVHLAALIAGLGYAGLLLPPGGAEQTIAVDLVTPQEVAELAKPPEPTPTPIPLPTLTDSESRPAAAAQAAPPDQAAAAKPEPPPQSQPQPETVKPEPVKPEPATAQSQPVVQQPVIQQPEPDISVRYPMNPSLFGRAPGDFDAKASSAAQIDGGAIAAFREKLKTCSTLPTDVAPDDKVVIVIRAQFAPDGRLSATPILIEASASRKGPLLMQAAISALQACQPFASLPPDKYQEWQMLDLSFTPMDFRKS